MKNKVKKRYQTKEQIFAEIERCQAKAEQLLREADEAESLSKTLMQFPNLIEDGKYRRVQAAKLRRSASRITGKKLVHLKEKLAEFLTPKLPALDNGDGSVNA